MTQQSELNLQGIDFEEGYIAVIDKPLEWTSSDVVRKIKFALRRAGYPKIKVGHAGTLDPLATGILLVCIGKATKNGGRPASRGERVRRRPDAGRYDPQLRPRTPHRQDLSLRTYQRAKRSRRYSARSPANGCKPRPSIRPRRSKASGPTSWPRGRRGGTAQSAHQHLRNRSSWNTTCPASASGSGAARGPTSVRWPERSARRSAAVRTSPRSAAPAAEVFGSMRRTN